MKRLKVTATAFVIGMVMGVIVFLSGGSAGEGILTALCITFLALGLGYDEISQYFSD